MKEKILAALDYDKETGVFTRKSGKPAGTVDNGRLRIYVDYKSYRAHRIAWLLIYGEWPKGDIDHIDGNPLNNRISNLRDVTRSVNMQNQRRARSDNKLGLLGVSSIGNKYTAEIVIDGKRKYLGRFDDKESASNAYLAEKRQHHVGCTI